MSDVVIRPMSTSDDPTAVWEMAYSTLRQAGLDYGWQMPELDAVVRERGTRRILHTLSQDPAGSFVADRGGEVVGVSIATRRGPLWFLSLLTVARGAQGQGIGRGLIDAALQTRGELGAICASDDPKALRRYRHAGFDLVPCYEAHGPLDRSLLPAVTGVRAGSYDDDRALIEDVATLVRGTPHGPDLDFFAALPRPLFVTDTPAGRGYVACTDSAPALLAATTERAARSLLWTALAETTAEKLEVMWLRHDQQWALDVAFAARLSLRPTGSFCRFGDLPSLSYYLPNGAFG